MSTITNPSHYAACQIKFAFDVSTESPLAWYEYFGWDDEFDMLNAFCKKHLNSDELSFSEVDCGGAKLTVVFETNCEPSDFNARYNQALSILERLSVAPEYNPCPSLYNRMLETLEEAGVVVYDNEADRRVFDEFNKIDHGFATYQEHLAHIAARNKAA